MTMKIKQILCSFVISLFFANFTFAMIKEAPPKEAPPKELPKKESPFRVVPEDSLADIAKREADKNQPEQITEQLQLTPERKSARESSLTTSIESGFAAFTAKKEQPEQKQQFIEPSTSLGDVAKPIQAPITAGNEKATEESNKTVVKIVTQNVLLDKFLKKAKQDYKKAKAKIKNLVAQLFTSQKKIAIDEYKEIKQYSMGIVINEIEALIFEINACATKGDTKTLTKILTDLQNSVEKLKQTIAPYFTRLPGKFKAKYLELIQLLNEFIDKVLEENKNMANAKNKIRQFSVTLQEEKEEKMELK